VKSSICSRVVLLLSVLGPLCATSGCNFLKTGKHRWLAPQKVIRSVGDISPVKPILESTSIVDQAQELAPDAEFPREGDWQYSDADYIIGASDILSISILDLFDEGRESVLQRQVSESGYIDLPELAERVKAEGLTEQQLKEAIIQAYSLADILKAQSATVAVTIVAKRQSTFSVLGAVARPATFNVVRRDMRLLEALALAGGVSQPNIRYIYVIRQQLPARGRVSLPARPPAGQSAVPKLPPLPEIPEEVPGGETQPDTAPSEAAPPTPPSEETNIDALRELEDESSGSPSNPEPLPYMTELDDGSQPAAAATRPEGPDDLLGAERTYKWVFDAEGRLIRVPQDAPAASQPSGEGAATVRPAGEPPVTIKGGPDTEDITDPFGWQEASPSGTSRIIAIDLERLRQGDSRMNVVIRDRDVVHVPQLTVGEFYITGEVLRPGVYSLTGRRVTIKQAIAAAGALGPLAWPENSILIRRVGNSEEQMLPINIEKIFTGETPDIFLKPNDVIAVGTDFRAPFYAVVRNAFRMTYGFGFIYDRNFADAWWLGSRRFTRW